MPFEALFLGVGGGFGSTSFNDPYLYAQGVSEISQGGVPVAVGAAGGSTDPGFGSDGRLAPIVQFGGFRHFDGSDWLWGAKFTYGYLDASSSVANLPVPQSGGYENLTDDPSTSFGGNVVVHSYETRITHQISFVPFIGRSYEKMFVYAGAGPTVSRVESNLDGVIGFAEINGQHVDVTGAPSNFSSEEWVFGGAVTVGLTYFFTPQWFVDVNYTYARTADYSGSFSTPFSSSTDGYDDVGILSGNYSGSLTTQAVAISINRAF
ncbi:outer membrane protein [Ancylobacter dichloromethanicus]|uniref:outer membrane protein n=1 Tax=Ancylobacter dichloromethanicus TaxID=518825 RepID=UPI0036184C09